jgi:hypothetical protein
MKKILIALLIIILVGGLWYVLGIKNDLKGYGENERYSTLASSSTLSAAFTGAGSVTSTVSTDGMRKKALAFRYLPKSHDSSFDVLIEEALDSNCKNYNPLFFTDTSSTNITFVNSTNTSGLPYRFPYDGVTGHTVVTASGTLYGGKFDLPDSVSQCMRVSAKENTTSTAGIITLELLTTN